MYDPPDAPAVAILASYEPSEGVRDELGRLKFHDHPEFTPSLTPKQVLHILSLILTKQTALSLHNGQCAPENIMLPALLLALPCSCPQRFCLRRQVIQAGSWGGCYFNPRGGRAGIFGRVVDITHEEFPADW